MNDENILSEITKKKEIEYISNNNILTIDKQDYHLEKTILFERVANVLMPIEFNKLSIDKI